MIWLGWPHITSPDDVDNVTNMERVCVSSNTFFFFGDSSIDLASVRYLATKGVQLEQRM